MSPNDAAVHEVQVPVDPPGCVSLCLQSLQEALPDPRLAPAIKPARHRPDGAVAIRQVAPRGARAQDPQNAVQNGAMIMIGATRPRPLRRQQWRETPPLLIRQCVTLHTPHMGTPTARRTLCRDALALRWHSRQRASCEAGQTVRTSQVHGVSELIKQHAPDAGEAGLRRRSAGLPFFPAWRPGGADPARTDTPSASSARADAARATSGPRSGRARALP